MMSRLRSWFKSWGIKDREHRYRNMPLSEKRVERERIRRKMVFLEQDLADLRYRLRLLDHGQEPPNRPKFPESFKEDDVMDE